MALERDLSSLPKPASIEGEGVQPDAHPRFVDVLVNAWDANRDDDKPTATGTRLRHSDAGKCARALAYTAAGIPRSDPMDLAGTWNVSLGTLLHEKWQDALQAAHPDAEVETKVSHDDLDASGHIDAVIRIPEGGEWVDVPDDDATPTGASGFLDKVIAYELKTIGGYGYKAAIGKARRGTPAEGPKVEHVLQAALNGVAVNADEIVVGYLAKECISVNQAGDIPEVARFAAEWTFTRDEYEPLAAAEKARMAGILGILDDHQELAARKFPAGLLPKGAEIVDPTKGRWEVRDGDDIVDTGSFWACGYCPYRTVCATTTAGRIPVASVVVEAA